MPQADAADRRVVIVLLNWNGWADTLHCLETLYRLQTPGVRVIVCDNGSGDDSLDRIQAWADGRLQLVPETGPLGYLSDTPVSKPLACERVNAVEFASRSASHGLAALTLVANGANLGYAGGNNVALRQLLRRDDFDHVWLLNNDTLVPPDALDALLTRMAVGDIGLCGSTLLFHDRPETVQCQGGAAFWRWIGLSRLLGGRRPLAKMLPQDRVERRLDHLYGASMLVSRPALHALGPLPERFFLYYEEVAWLDQAATPPALGYAAASRVYHRKGASAGTANRGQTRSALATYYLAHSRLLYTRDRFPAALPLVYLLLGLEYLLRTLRRDHPQATALADVLLGRRRPPP